MVERYTARPEVPTSSMGRRHRAVWMVAIAAAFGLAAWVVLGLGQFSVQPGQQSNLAQRYASGEQQIQDSREMQSLSGDGSDGIWGREGGTSTLVLYDTAGTATQKGDAETDAIVSGNLATHFGQVEALPMAEYTAAMMRSYDAVVYVSSNEAQRIPRSFYDDMIGGSTPVLWAGANIAEFDSGDAALTARFQANYGWDPASSVDTGEEAVSEVRYGGQALTRQAEGAPSVLVPEITSPEQVEVLATMPDVDERPWAIRSDNLTFIGEVPLSYVDESDRYLAFADMFYDLLASQTEAVQQASIRLEDVDAGADPAELRAIADYLSSKDIPFQVAVVPARIAKTDDPESADRIGLGLQDKPEVLAALKYMTERGGTLIHHGTTHQYQSLDNPYNGSSGADFEFFRAKCSATQSEPYEIEPCTNDSYVVTTGPVGSDGVEQWVQRLNEGRELFVQAGLDEPTIFETPHYAASANAYRAMDEVYNTRYERSQYFPGQLSGTTLQQDRGVGQYFPFRVHDFYGSTVLPENLGNPTQNEQNGNEIRDPQLIVDNAEKNLVVRESTASFFYHPFLGVDPLREVVEGIEGLGYTFVPAADLK
ncbi:MAG: polysaccharide deacetylase family protein [Ornithinimicrobium sp.]